MNQQPPPDKPDNFVCVGATGDSPLGMFAFYVVVVGVAIAAVAMAAIYMFDWINTP